MSNQWAEFINQIVTADDLKTGVNMLTGLLSVITDISSALGSFGTIGVGAGLIAGIKNVGGLKFRESCSNMPDLSLCKVNVLHNKWEYFSVLK